MGFDVAEFEEALDGRLIIEIYEVKPDIGVVYVGFREGNVRYIKASIDHLEYDNCINIYHGKNSKSGYWWDGELDYKDLVDEIMHYV